MPEGIPTAAGGHTATTNSTTDQPTLAVTQADREAAANLVVPHGRWPGFPADFRSGRADSNELTQAFARHRTNSEPRPAGDLREAITNAILVADTSGSLWRGDLRETILHLVATHSPAPMALQIGDRVKVAEGAEFAADWQRMDLWVAGLAVDDRGRGINVTVSEQWPIPSRHSRSYMGQTDDFIVDRTDGRPDDLTRVAHPSTQEG